MFVNFPDRLEEVFGEEAMGGKVVTERAAEASGNFRAEH